MSQNPFFHIDEKHNARTFGVTGSGWAGIWVVLHLPIIIGFPVLLFWNLSVTMLLKHAGYIPYPVTQHYCKQAAGALLACCFLFPIPVLIWGLRRDTKIKLTQLVKHRQYLNEKLARLRAGEENAQNEKERNVGV